MEVYMNKTKLRSCVYVISTLIAVIWFSGLTIHASGEIITPERIERSIIKNVSVFLPDGKWQAGSFVVIKGCKIEKIGSMSAVPRDEVFDNEYDLKGKYVYPGFIDPLYIGFQTVEKKKAGFGGGIQQARMGRGSSEPLKEYKRKSFEKRNYFIKRKAVERLKLDEKKAKSVIQNGFTVAHVVLLDGIIGGVSTVVSLASEEVEDAVLVPECFMGFSFNPNRSEYPTMIAGIIAEMKQIKADSYYYHKMMSLQTIHPTMRRKYIPEYDILYPYFEKKKRFLMVAGSYPEQRMMELVKKRLDIDPVMVMNPELWRRDVDSDADIILPLGFEPPRASKYANMGEKIKKEAEEKINPAKLSDFLKTHKNVSFTAPKNNDYKTFFKSIPVLFKQGVSEARIVAALTTVPAKLLNISDFTGSIETGKLANLAVMNQKITQTGAKAAMVFVDGKPFEFKSNDLKPGENGKKKGKKGKKKMKKSKKPGNRE
jgi:hypothetical protein